MENFRGEKSRLTEFGHKTTISGHNGVGKSRHMDAFLWCLFGKDRHDRKDYEVKTRIKGEVLHHTNTKVTAVLTVGGVDMQFERTLTEKWGKPMGQEEERFEGNGTECKINGVAVRVTDYERKVSEIFGGSFKVLSNPMHFLSLQWKDMRDILFDLVCGEVSDSHVADGNDDFKALLERAKLATDIDTYRKEVSARKRLIKAELEEIQPRIDQTRKIMPTADDWGLLDMQLEEVNSRIAEYDKELTSKQSSNAKQEKENAEKWERVLALGRECSEILGKEMKRLTAVQCEEERAKSVALAEVARMERELTAVQTEKETNTSKCKNLQSSISQSAEELATLRKEWADMRAKEYIAGVCPTCGQQYTPDRQNAERTMFAEYKKNNLEEITAKGKELAKTREKMTAELQEVETAMGDNDSKIKELTKGIEEAKKIAESMEVHKYEIDPLSIPEWVAKDREKEEIKASIETAVSDTDKYEQVKGAKAKAMSERDGILSRLSKREMIDKGEEEIATLQAKSKELNINLCSAEQEEATIQAFIEAKCEASEDAINSQFDRVRFKLFEKTLDGKLVPTCIPMIDGVPYGSANTSGRIIGGLDVVKTLQMAMGMNVPIFIDNAESVNEIPNMPCQTVLLQVTNGGMEVHNG